MKKILTILSVLALAAGCSAAAPELRNLRFDSTTGLVYADKLATGQKLNFEELVVDTLTLTNPIPDSAIPSAIARDTEVSMTLTGTHSTPNTTTPLSPTWTGQAHMVFQGATGTINLPAAASYAGKAICVYNTGAFTITIDADGSEVIVRDGTAQTGGVSMTLSSGAGNFVWLVSSGTRWITLGYKGTLAAGS